MSKRHDWVAIVPYTVTVEDGLRIVGAIPSPTGPPTGLAGDEVPAPDDARPFLGTHNVRQELVTVGCFECEQPLTADTSGTDCPGDPGSALRVGDVEVRGGNAALGFGGVGRNDPCPCGSGQKFKRCHG